MKWLLASEERRISVALVALSALVYLPLAGNYGLWDPWEARYSEVARQMVERNDWISLWNPCSPLERAEFWSKPVFTFWLIALSMKLFGLQTAGASAAEMTTSWRPEWAARLPGLLLAIATVWLLFWVTSRLAGRRAALFSSVILATSTQWLLLARQAMVDMPFVAPMCGALGLAALALLAPPEDMERELPRRRWRRWSWPHTASFYALLILVGVFVVPQLVVFSIQLQLTVPFGSARLRVAGIVVMLPYIAALGGAVWWCARARARREAYLALSYVLGGLASLAKGPAGIALPGLVLVAFLVAAGRWRAIFVKLDLPRGTLLFLVTAAPWYHAMLIRHGAGFWNEFIGDNYLHRAVGRHGDRGGVDYYAEWLLYGMFPWSGMVAAGVVTALRRQATTARERFRRFLLCWLIVELTVLTAVGTKFHHYLLPILPPSAALAGLYIDDFLDERRRFLPMVAILVTGFVGYDLAIFPARILWLFNYDYVNMPGTGRPWPEPALYGDRYEYSRALFVVGAGCLVGLAALLFSSRRTPVVAAPNQKRFVGVGAVWLASLAVAIASGPGLAGGVVVVHRHGWLIPLGGMVAGAAVVLARRHLRFFVAALGALVWCAFVADKMLVELSPHWAQKHVIGAYYAQRRGPEEPLLAWNLFWHGETFYTRNAIYESADPRERTVFLGDRPAEHLQEYFRRHPNRRMFFVVERRNLSALRALLPAADRDSLRIVDDSDNKLYLTVADIH